MRSLIGQMDRRCHFALGWPESRCTGRGAEGEDGHFRLAASHATKKKNQRNLEVFQMCTIFNKAPARVHAVCLGKTPSGTIWGPPLNGILGPFTSGPFTSCLAILNFGNSACQIPGVRHLTHHPHTGGVGRFLKSFLFLRILRVILFSYRILWSILGRNPAKNRGAIRCYITILYKTQRWATGGAS